MAYYKTHKKDLSKDENNLQRHSYEDEIDGKKSDKEHEDHNPSTSSIDENSKRLSLTHMSFTPFFDWLVIDLNNEDIEQKMDNMFFEGDAGKTKPQSIVPKKISMVSLKSCFPSEHKNPLASPITSRSMSLDELIPSTPNKIKSEMMVRRKTTWRPIETIKLQTDLKYDPQK